MEPEDRQGIVATIGVFDGVHRGHRALFERVINRARSKGATSMAITFEPHPVAILAPPAEAHRLTSRALQTKYICELGIDRLWYLPFSRAMASLSPGEFVRTVLRQIDLRELWVGYDFRFGKNRAGNFEFLRAEGDRLGFKVYRFDAVRDEDRILSSSSARDALRDGAIELASSVLGHSFYLQAQVIRGQGLGGRELVPTANLDLPDDQILPARGVYAAWAELPEPGTDLIPAVVNIGLRPTVTESDRDLLEAHLIDWSGDLYEQTLGLHFGTRIREERRFGGIEELRAAIADDIRMARQWLEGRTPPQRPAEPQ